MDQRRTCRGCGEAKPLIAEFWHRDHRQRQGFSPRCKSCDNPIIAAGLKRRRRAAGAQPKVRNPRMVEGAELWECRTKDCGWHPIGAYYLSKKGTPLCRCKRCEIALNVERARTPERKARANASALEKRWRNDPEGRARRDDRVALDALGKKRCKVCHRAKAYSHFSPWRDQPRGSTSICRLCRKRTDVVKKRYWKAPERYRFHSRTRHARKRGAPIQDFTPEQWERIKADYDYRCAYCHDRAEELTEDHVHPVSRGGAHTASNIVPACRSCNSSKCDRTLDEWIAAGGRPLRPHQERLLA